MLKDLLSPAECSALRSFIDGAQKIVICCHVNPDGDAIGASLGWADYLRSLGKEPAVVVPDQYPDFLQWMPGTEKIVRYDKRKAEADALLAKADLVFCLDFNQPSRTDAMADALVGSPGAKVMFDHHLDPAMPGCALTVSHTEMCSTSEVVFRVVWQLGGFPQAGRGFAAPVYCGMMTDTGGFTYNSNDPEIYLIISRLLTKGIDKDKIYRNVFNNYTESRLRLMGYVLYERLRFLAGGRATLFTLTREDMARFNYIRGDAEGFVNLPLQVRGTRLSISLREDTETDIIRVSLRSVDDFPCNRMAAEFFNGGGHLNASGGRLPWPLEEAVRTVEQAVEAYLPLLEKS